MEEKKTERLLFWDILKGIGIVSIVFGHSQNLGILIRAVYYYHLAIFFFVSGYLFNEERYGDKPFEFFARRLKNMWMPYVCYGGLFVLLHNFLTVNRLFPSEYYGRKDMLYALSDTLFLHCSEGPAGAMWFIPVMLAVGIVFSVLLWFCRNYLPSPARPWALAFFCGLAGFVGVILNRGGIRLDYHVQTALLVVPVYYGGYLLRVKKIDPEKYVAWPGVVFCGVLLSYFLLSTNESVELSVNVIPRGVNFYVISAAGIYLCCFAAKCLQKHPKAGGAAALLGKYSFDIMALHFLVFKVVDWIYGLLINDPIENRVRFPHSYGELHLLYLVLGVVLPVVLAIAARKAIHRAGHDVRLWAGSQEK
ncbi:MAG: acyltransferase [Lacrimispora sp.]